MEDGCITFAPRDAISNISSYEILSICFAFELTLGSVV